MKKSVLAVGAGLAIVAGAAVVEAQRRPDRGAIVTDQGRVEQGPGARGRFGIGPAQRGRRGFGGFAQAGPGRGGPMRGFGRGMGGPMLAGLELTEEQRTTIAEIRRGERDAAGPAADELGVARRALHRVTFADARDDGEIAKLTTTIANLEKQRLDLHVKTELAVAAVLTPEQREKVRAGRGGGRGAGR
jgi:Spy/CpxP family protein refolding chaperone